MTAFGVIRLDTVAPAVAWGQPSDAVASETFTVSFATDEPALRSAVLVLADGRLLGVEVGDDVLTCQLPDDAAEGWATLRATVRDDVGNEAVRTLQVYVTGVIAPVPAGPPVLASPPQVRVDRIASPPTHAHVYGDHRVAVAVVQTSTARLSARYSSTAPRTLRTSAAGRVAVRWSPPAATPRGAASHAAGATTEDSVVRRPEGPEAEDELLLLDLL